MAESDTEMIDVADQTEEYSVIHAFLHDDNGVPFPTATDFRNSIHSTQQLRAYGHQMRLVIGRIGELYDDVAFEPPQELASEPPEELDPTVPELDWQILRYTTRESDTAFKQAIYELLTGLQSIVCRQLEEFKALANDLPRENDAEFSMDEMFNAFGDLDVE